MANGNIETIPYQTGFFTTSINNINNINTGLKAVMEEQLKSERLKTELITNVSHDLKTPLTSIISYVDLLQAMNLDNEKANEYIGIIKNKSRRLKILIDDLFEASKLSSGQMKLEKRNADVVSLLEQTLGELDYKLEDAHIEFSSIIKIAFKSYFCIFSILHIFRIISFHIFSLSPASFLPSFSRTCLFLLNPFHLSQ